jgi:hypothetical protein
MQESSRPDESLNFSNLSNPSRRSIALGFTQPLTEMSSRNGNENCSVELSPAGACGWRPHRHLWTDRLENVGFSTSHNLLGIQGLLRGELYFLILLYTFRRIQVMENWFIQDGIFFGCRSPWQLAPKALQSKVPFSHRVHFLRCFSTKSQLLTKTSWKCMW